MKVIQLSYPQQITTDEVAGAYSLALGFFDGVHRGHQAVINTAKKTAEQTNTKLAVMTFDPHPSIVLGQSKEKVFYITPLKQKIAILERLGVDTLFVVRFTSDFAQLSPADFIQLFVKGLGVKHVTAGFDYTFGKKGQGNMEIMPTLCGEGISVEVVDKQLEESDKISSTRIRQLLLKGDMENVHQLLGRPYRTPGVVVHGDKRGRTIGFPTANVQSADGSFIPANGVYVVKIRVQNEWFVGVCNIGYKPTFKNPDEKNLSIEVHIVDFDKNIYGEEVEIDWYKWVRAEQKFNGIDELVAQLGKDKQASIEFFA
ncbi:MAG: bifunctional riboflavin kinase/FAD synthetase [Kurthia sp.]|uniref:Riboflavin biosynthesis protein n=1 Tax=Kurthia zopfii TaxID=1650 RepID=A0A2U3AE27_9BACL|nr:bifunctional riboflavin kinase/FAD synthetase [Kurthia zopfii]PWI22775.1 bifunctional riboflavin kinase/FAD synthetase [Kurthia zopfii]TDR41816.1 riboflavin kinase/FMN adenylyltransferase [Kurthia zopfii]STX09127.1 Riboflavin biosynthesis protein ribF [Kurthia zopfii]VEI04658.1 Riboflavin biosynthesis protein ribF [Kurthia zopfii]GEK32014.1 riboflavin biosynthesis protein [Kurthia zopfii]